jgi:hypothetical protein
MGKKDIRKNFRVSVFKRDYNRCAVCMTSTNITAHHITDRNDIPNGGYVKENGISLCEVCHILAEQFHISDGEHWEPGFHPDDLYSIVDSSKELAFKRAEQ